MRLIPSFLAVCALAALAALSGCATARSDRHAEFTAWRIQVIATLREQRDPDSLIAAALLSESVGVPDDDPDPDLVAALAAAAAASDSAAIAALHLLVCLQRADCDHATAATALQRVDLDNGLALWPQVRSALQSGDEGRIDAALTQLAQSGSFNLHQNASVVTAVRSIRRTALPALPGEPEIEVASSLAAEMLGSYSVYALQMVRTTPSLLDTCRTSEAASQRHRMCLQILSTMLASDVTILQMLGASWACRIASPGTAELDRARATFRHNKWRSEHLMSALRRGVKERQGEHVQRYLDVQIETMRLNAREEDSERAHAVALGFAPDPPENWQPKHRLVVGNCGLV
jgi:hypothetical protein